MDNLIINFQVFYREKIDIVIGQLIKVNSVILSLQYTFGRDNKNYNGRENCFDIFKFSIINKQLNNTKVKKIVAIGYDFLVNKHIMVVNR